MDFKVVWRDNPISVVNGFGTRGCRLCMAEKLHILENTIGEKRTNKFMNSCDEIYGSCRHNAKFHQLVDTNTNLNTCHFCMDDSGSDTDNDESGDDESYSLIYFFCLIILACGCVV